MSDGLFYTRRTFEPPMRGITALYPTLHAAASKTSKSIDERSILDMLESTLSHAPVHSHLFDVSAEPVTAQDGVT